MTQLRRAQRRGRCAVVVGAVALVGALLPVGNAGPAAADVVPAVHDAAVSGAPTSLAAVADPASVARGGSARLTGRLTDPTTGAGVVGASVQVEVVAGDGTWAVVDSAVTDGGGGLAVEEVLDASTTFRLHYGSAGAVEESWSEPLSVAVLPMTAELSGPAVRVGRPVTVSGVLAAGAHRTVRLERRVGSRWQELSRATTGPGGAYSVSVTPSAAGFWWLRVSGGGVTAALPRLDAYRLHTYSVRTRGAIRADMGVFRASVAETYADPRGWMRAHHRFRPAAPGRAGDVTVVLSEARYLPAYSWECSRSYSCRVGRNVVINQARWRTGSRHFPGTLEEYRAMVVNHETGHWLGRGHAYCSGRGRLAPVMQQQSKGMQGCRVNPWPLPREIRAVR